MLPRALVLLNGPPRCGKDTAAAYLGRRARGLVARRGMADPLKVACHAAHGLYDIEGRPLPYNAFESVKDNPRPEFYGRTPRACYIAHSEAYLKPLHGAGIFGHLFLRGLIESNHAPVVAVPDAGFAPETAPAIGAIGPERVLLVRIHADRRGCSFAGDSRGYIELPDVVTYDLDNDGRGPDGFLADLGGLVRGWLETLDDTRDAALEPVRDAMALTSLQPWRMDPA